MIGALRKLFEAPPGESPEVQRHRVRLAAAALLIETARADFSEDQREQQALRDLLCSSLGLAQAEIARLLEQASNKLDQATSLYEFTRVINDYYSPTEKLQLISAMWQVAYADGNLDKYEEHLIRQVAELTFVPHQDYIRVKLEAKG
jgi:uncharacterized tellurite resistance protein B-like protein